MVIKDFIIQKDATIAEALKLINDNKAGFLIVTGDGKAVGTITDGDIRRGFLSGRSTESKVAEVCCTQFTSVRIGDDFSKVVEIFKSKSIEFLPILGEDGELQNIVTRGQMHTVLLKDRHVDLTHPFLEEDDSLIDHEIYQRPWGFYKTTMLNQYFQSKIINVKPRASLSLQMHHRREEHWIVVHGSGTVQLDDSRIHVHDGSYLFIPKGCKHRLTNDSDTESLIMTEVQLGDYFGEDDIERFEDIYGRV